jgi:hypothetical protein
MYTHMSNICSMLDKIMERDHNRYEDVRVPLHKDLYDLRHINSTHAHDAALGCESEQRTTNITPLTNDLRDGASPESYQNELCISECAYGAMPLRPAILPHRRDRVEALRTFEGCLV